MKDSKRSGERSETGGGGGSTSSKSTLRFEDGATQFRQRVAVSLLSHRPILIRNIRSDDLDSPGLREHEASFLRLIDAMTDGTNIEINATGTQLRMKPGVLLGGEIEHDCPLGSNENGFGGGGRSTGWFLEGILPLAPFGKEPLELILRGITDGGASDLDPTPDYARASFLPLLMRFGVGNSGGNGGPMGDDSPPSLIVERRGAYPLGGGVVRFHCPIVKELSSPASLMGGSDIAGSGGSGINNFSGTGSGTPLDLTDFGKVKRVRGTAVSCKIPPTSAARASHSAKGVLHRLLPDVWIHTDVHSSSRGGNKAAKGGGGGCGPSPGLSMILTATTTLGVILSSECGIGMEEVEVEVFDESEDRDDGGLGQNHRRTRRRTAELPEDMGTRAAASLLEQISRGGCVDGSTQSLALIFMALGPEGDVARIRLGKLSPYTVVSLRLFKAAFGVEFKLRTEEVEEKEEEGVVQRGSGTILCSCLGTGYRNMAKAST